MVSLRDKIEDLIEGLGLTPMRFADVIGVKRPIISHILAGRNKPSLDIVHKIVTRFPILEYSWIGDENELDPDLVQNIKENDDFNIGFYSARESNESINSTEDNEILNSQAEPKKNKSVKKIVFFYSDGTFETYDPEIMTGL